jgi:3-hydroxybutyryl-CoA dehydrogenase
MIEPTEARRTSPPIQQVLVLGGGLMGSQIAFEYAAFGHAVQIQTKSPGLTRERLHAAAQVAVAVGLGTAEDLTELADTMPVASAIPTDEHKPNLIVECLPEDLDLKVNALTPLMGWFPRATVATNTSSFSIEVLASRLPDPSRVLGTHYWNPPLLMSLVELIATKHTAETRVREVVTILQGMRKRPIQVGDAVGFVWNRLQFCLLREASWIVSQGIASAREVDTIVEAGLARRWVKNGPFATAQLGGTETFKTIAAQILPDLSSSTDLQSLPSQTYLDTTALHHRADQRDRYLASQRAQDIADPEAIGASA